MGRLCAAATSPFPRSAAACVEVMAAFVCRALTEKARASVVGKLWKRENEIFLHMPSPCFVSSRGEVAAISPSSALLFKVLDGLRFCVLKKGFPDYENCCVKEG